MENVRLFAHNSMAPAPGAARATAPRVASGGKLDSQRTAAAAKAETQKKYAELSRKQAQKYKASDNSVEAIRLRVRQVKLVITPAPP
eukprot:5570164-Pleurochrysis_carterae.AAC.2